MEEAKQALAAYGASLDDEGFIVRQGKRLVKILRGRDCFHFVDVVGTVFATTPDTAQGVKNFVEKVWLWKKVSS